MDHPTASADASSPPSLDGDALLQRAMLKELAEMGMEVCRAIARQVRAAEAVAEAAAAPPPTAALSPAHLAAIMADPEFPPPAPAPYSSTRPPPAPALTPADCGLAFDRAARAARHAIALWSRLGHDEQARAAAARRVAEEQRRAEAGVRRVQAAGVIERVAAAHYEAALPGEDDDAAAVSAVRRVAREAAERLGDEGLYGDLPDRPFSEIVARLCAELGLAPDWPPLAQEQWARAELGGGAPGAPLAGLGSADAPPPSPGLADGPPLQSLAWRRRGALRADPEEGPQQTRVTVRIVEPDGKISKDFDEPWPDARRAAARPPDPVRAPVPRPEPPPPPDPPPAERVLSEEEIAAADYARRMHLAEYGPRGNGRPDWM